MKFLLPAFLLCFLIPFHINAGGPWAQGKLKGYSEISTNLEFNQFTTMVGLQSYTEFGITKNLTLKAIIPVNYLSTEKDADNHVSSNPNGSLWGMGNVTFGANYQLINKGIALSVGCDFMAKTFNSDSITGLRTGYEKWSFKPTLAIGKGFSKAYISAELYTSITTNRYSEEVGLVLDGGYKLGGKMWIGLYAHYLQSIENGDFQNIDHPAFMETGFYDNDEHSLTLGLKLSYLITEKFGVNATPLWVAGLSESYTAISVKLGVFVDW